MPVFSIGFAQKDARTFFGLLRYNHVRLIVDIRLNNSSQLAGYTKGKDLEFFLRELVNANYLHDLGLAPTKSLLDGYRKGDITWGQYEVEFARILNERKITESSRRGYLNNLDGVCFLCSEAAADQCHRRLVIEHIIRSLGREDLEVLHL